jgi:hypothetical protein
MGRALHRSTRYDLTFEITSAADKIRLVTCLLWSQTWRCASWTRSAPDRIACAVIADGQAMLPLKGVPEGAYVALLLELAAPDDMPMQTMFGFDVMSGAASNGICLDEAITDPRSATFLLSGSLHQQIDLCSRRSLSPRRRERETEVDPWRST